MVLRRAVQIGLSATVDYFDVSFADRNSLMSRSRPMCSCDCWSSSSERSRECCRCRLPSIPTTDYRPSSVYQCVGMIPEADWPNRGPHKSTKIISFCNSRVHCSTGPQQNVDDDYFACRVKAVGGGGRGGVFIY